MSAKWRYNEYQLSGTDFHDEKEARLYMDRIAVQRNSADEAILVAERIGLEPGHRLLDIGAGPGLISVELAGKCREVVATDISDIMLKLAAERAGKMGVRNIRFEKGGFLNGGALDEKFNRVITQRAFHHVPDFWKQIALMNIYRVLNPGGIFYLDDVIYTFKAEDYEHEFDGWIEVVKGIFGQENAYTAENHILKEYSHFDWVMEGMLERTGFEIIQKILPDKFFAQYVCRKK